MRSGVELFGVWEGTLTVYHPRPMPRNPNGHDNSAKDTLNRYWLLLTLESWRVAGYYDARVEGAWMRMKKPVIGVTPAQAKWILERLIADRRISVADVQRLLAGLGEEIADIERRLASLREAAGRPAVAVPAPPRKGAATPSATKVRKKRRGRERKGHAPRGIAGTLAVLLRSIPAAKHAAIAAIRADKGIKAAIKAAQASAKRT